MRLLVICLALLICACGPEWHEAQVAGNPFVYSAKALSEARPDFSPYGSLAQSVKSAIMEGQLQAAPENGWFEITPDPPTRRILVRDTRDEAAGFGEPCIPEQANVSCSAMSGLTCRDARCLCPRWTPDEEEAARAALVPDEYLDLSGYLVRETQNPAAWQWAIANVAGMKSRPGSHAIKIAPTAAWLPSENRCMFGAERREACVTGSVRLAIREVAGRLVRFVREGAPALPNGVRYKVTPDQQIVLDTGSRLRPKPGTKITAQTVLDQYIEAMAVAGGQVDPAGNEGVGTQTFGDVCMPGQHDRSCSALQGLDCRKSRCLCPPTTTAEMNAAVTAAGRGDWTGNRPVVDRWLGIERLKDNKKDWDWLRKNVSGFKYPKESESYGTVRFTVHPSAWWIPDEKRCMSESERRSASVTGKVLFGTPGFADRLRAMAEEAERERAEGAAPTD